MYILDISLFLRSCEHFDVLVMKNMIVGIYFGINSVFDIEYFEWLMLLTTLLHLLLGQIIISKKVSQQCFAIC